MSVDSTVKAIVGFILTAVILIWGVQFFIKNTFWRIVVAVLIISFILGSGLVNMNFDAESLKITLIDQEIVLNNIQYTLSVINEGKLALKNNTLYLSPGNEIQVKDENIIEKLRVIKPGQSLKLTVDLPEYKFNGLQPSEINKSQILIKGYVNWGPWFVPYSMGGSVSKGRTLGDIRPS